LVSATARRRLSLKGDRDGGKDNAGSGRICHKIDEKVASNGDGDSGKAGNGSASKEDGPPNGAKAGITIGIGEDETKGENGGGNVNAGSGNICHKVDEKVASNGDGDSAKAGNGSASKEDGDPNGAKAGITIGIGEEETKGKSGGGSGKVASGIISEGAKAGSDSGHDDEPNEVKGDNGEAAGEERSSVGEGLLMLMLYLIFVF
jgi:hypothetical protein